MLAGGAWLSITLAVIIAYRSGKMLYGVNVYGLPIWTVQAVTMLADSRARVARIKKLGIFDEDMFLREVYQPILEDLGVQPRELRKFTKAISARD